MWITQIQTREGFYPLQNQLVLLHGPPSSNFWNASIYEFKVCIPIKCRLSFLFLRKESHKGKYYVVFVSFWEVAGDYWAGVVNEMSVKMHGEEDSVLEYSVPDLTWM